MNTSELSAQETGRLGGLTKAKNARAKAALADRLTAERPLLEAQIQNLCARNNLLIDELLKRGITSQELVELFRQVDANAPLIVGAV